MFLFFKLTLLFVNDSNDKTTVPATMTFTAQKMKFSIKDFLSKCDQISFLRIWSHLLKKSLMENFIFCAVFGERSTLER